MSPRVWVPEQAHRFQPHPAYLSRCEICGREESEDYAFFARTNGHEITDAEYNSLDEERRSYYWPITGKWVEQ